MKKSRRQLSGDNQGDFMLISEENVIVAGERFDMTLDEVEEYLKDE